MGSSGGHKFPHVSKTKYCICWHFSQYSLLQQHKRVLFLPSRSRSKVKVRLGFFRARFSRARFSQITSNFSVETFRRNFPSKFVAAFRLRKFLDFLCTKIVSSWFFFFLLSNSNPSLQTRILSPHTGRTSQHP